ncbi:F-box protein [uncultured Endozoicomonas sp.]|uniref:F-box protein n=1 Tax=uncultured Endozoicomonas sp. TaxID=432652 RepID=UPI00262A3391|nr:F-box protein [uncultured Endozoicomonas sp.]
MDVSNISTEVPISPQQKYAGSEVSGQLGRYTVETHDSCHKELLSKDNFAHWNEDLLRLILDHLRSIELVETQLVCRKWRDLIQKILIKRHELFFNNYPLPATFKKLHQGNSEQPDNWLCSAVVARIAIINSNRVSISCIEKLPLPPDATKEGSSDYHKKISDNAAIPALS